MPAPLLLVGTIHLDLRASRLLKDLLAAHRPDILSVEISRFSVAFRRAHEKDWLQRLGALKDELTSAELSHFRLRLLERQLAFPFEWTVARIYAAREGIPCLPVDSGALAREDLPLWESHLLTEQNLRAVLSEPDTPLASYFSRLYQEAGEILSEPRAWPQPGHPLAWLGDPFWGRRERLLAKRLRRLASLGRSIVHVGGWAHLVRGGYWPTVTDLLADHQPARCLITGQDTLVLPTR